MLSSLPQPGTYLILSATDGWIPGMPEPDSHYVIMAAVDDSGGYWTTMKDVALKMLQMGVSSDSLIELGVAHHRDYPEGLILPFSPAAAPATAPR